MGKRYIKKDEVKVGDRILFDNKTGFLKDVIRGIKIVGDVIDVDGEGNLIKVSFDINGVNEPLIKNIPYFLCQ